MAGILTEFRGWVRRSSAALALALIVSSLGASAAVAADEAAGKEIDAALATYEKAYNARKVDDLIAVWSKDADFVDHRGKAYQGRDAVADLFRRAFASDRKYQIKLKVTHRKFVSPDVAIDDGDLELLENNGEVERSRYVTIWGKSDGKWLMRSVRDIPVEAPPAEIAAPSLDGLDWLVGDWVNDPKQPTVKISCRWKTDRKFLIQEYEVSSGEKPFTVTVFIGWDPVNRHVRSWFFDSTGGYGQGAWQEREKKWVVSSNGVLPDGRLGSSIYTWAVGADKSLTWTATEREVDGTAIPDVTMTFHAVASKTEGKK